MDIEDISNQSTNKILGQIHGELASIKLSQINYQSQMLTIMAGLNGVATVDGQKMIKNSIVNTQLWKGVVIGAGAVLIFFLIASFYSKPPSTTSEATINLDGDSKTLQTIK